MFTFIEQPEQLKSSKPKIFKYQIKSKSPLLCPVMFCCWECQYGSSFPVLCLHYEHWVLPRVSPVDDPGLWNALSPGLPWLCWPWEGSLLCFPLGGILCPSLRDSVSSRFQLQVSDRAISGTVWWVSEWMESENWRLLCHLTPFSQGLSAHCSALLFLPRLSCQRGKIPHGKPMFQPLLEEKSQALGRLQPQCGCTLFAGSRMFFLRWARDFSSSNSDVEHQPLGPRNVRHGLSETYWIPVVH